MTLHSLLTIVLLCAATVVAPAQASPTDRQAHDQFVRLYVAAETQLLRCVRTATKAERVAPPQLAEIERLATARDIARRRAEESGLMFELPVPDRAEVLKSIGGGPEDARLFARADAMLATARRADTARLVVQLGLPKRI